MGRVFLTSKGWVREFFRPTLKVKGFFRLVLKNVYKQGFVDNSFLKASKQGRGPRENLDPQQKGVKSLTFGREAG